MGKGRKGRREERKEKEKGGRGGRGKGREEGRESRRHYRDRPNLIVQESDSTEGKERATITILVLDSNISRLLCACEGGAGTGRRGVTYKQRKDLPVRLGLLVIQYGQLRRGCLLKGSSRKSASYSSLLKLQNGDKAYHG
jgi:hypothetical protein